MEEQRSIFHANGVPLKYSIHRVTRACPPSSCRVHSSAFFLFLFSSSLFVVKKKKKIVSYLGQGRASPLIPWPLLSLLEIVVPRASQVTATDVSVCYRARSAEKGDYSRSSNLTREVSLPLFTCTLPWTEQGEYFQVDSNEVYKRGDV